MVRDHGPIRVARFVVTRDQWILVGIAFGMLVLWLGALWAFR